MTSCAIKAGFSKASFNQCNALSREAKSRNTSNTMKCKRVFKELIKLLFLIHLKKKHWQESW